MEGFLKIHCVPKRVTHTEITNAAHIGKTLFNRAFTAIPRSWHETCSSSCEIIFKRRLQMIKKNNAAILRLLVGILVLFLFNNYAFAKLVHNGAEESFAGPESTTIRGYIIEAAGHFLESHADFLLFLSRIELADLNGADYPGLQLLVNNTIAHMTDAKTKYTLLTQIADATPYDQAFIDRLLNFDHPFLQQGKNLDRVEFNQVETYLVTGDIRGAFHKTLTDTQQLLDMLTPIKSAVDAETLPETEDLWRLNQSFSETQLTGQYAAEVFSAVTGK